jgi:ABC-type nickel/cobalt efflux system permease component RcnA
MKKNQPLILASNLLLITAVVLVALWPITGKGLFGVLAFASLLLSASLGGMNMSQRGKRNGTRAGHDHEHDHSHDHPHDHGEHA